jgi:hypothetical protein
VEYAKAELLYRETARKSKLKVGRLRTRMNLESRRYLQALLAPMSTIIYSSLRGWEWETFEKKIRR